MTALLVLAIPGQFCIQQQAPYTAPVYQQQTYNQAYLEKTIFVAVEAQEAQAYYGGLVGQQQRAAERQAQVQQAAVSTDAKIDRLAALLEQLQKRLDASEPALPDKPSPANAPSPPVPALTPVASEAAPPPPTIAQASGRSAVPHAGLAVLTRSCAGCHSATAKSGGGVVLFATDGSFSARDRDDLERIEAAIASGRMPKRSANLTLREYIAVRDFLTGQASTLAANTTNQRK